LGCLRGLLDTKAQAVLSLRQMGFESHLANMYDGV